MSLIIVIMAINVRSRLAPKVDSDNNPPMGEKKDCKF